MKLTGNERGSLNVLLIPLVLVLLLFIATLVFGFWAYSGRQDYKNNVDQKISAAVADNTKKVQATDAAQYAEAAKQPFRTYVGPSDFGSVHISYPKTWSAYVDTSNSSSPVDGYFNPSVVPGANDPNSTFALRVAVVSQSYDQVMSQFQGLVQAGQVKVQPYALKNDPNIIGSRVDGQIEGQKQGNMVVLPLRSQALEIWTESNKYLSDFNNYILPNASFSP